MVPLKRLKNQGAKKVIFTACHSGRLKLTISSPNIISTSPQNVWWAGLILQFFCNLKSSKKLTCPSGQLKTEFTSLIAKSTSPGLLDATFFVRWKQRKLFNHHPWKVVAVAYKRWLFKTGSNSKALTLSLLNRPKPADRKTRHYSWTGQNRPLTTPLFSACLPTLRGKYELNQWITIVL